MSVSKSGQVGHEPGLNCVYWSVKSRQQIQKCSEQNFRCPLVVLLKPGEHEVKKTKGSVCEILIRLLVLESSSVERVKLLELEMSKRTNKRDVKV